MTSENSRDYAYTALLIGVPVLVGAGCCYIYYANKTSAHHQGQDDAKSSNVCVEDKSNPLDKVFRMKELGNQSFSSKNYESAIDHYTRGIELAKKLDPSLSDDDLAAFFQNRAAANESLGNLERVVEDCSKAIELKKDYSKAFRRRANAYFKLEQYDKAMIDAFSANILEKFQNQASIALTESIVETSSKAQAAEAMKKHKFDWPDDSLIRNYFAGLPTDPIKERLGGTNISIETCDQLKDIYQEALKTENDNDHLSILIRATCSCVMSDFETANKILDALLVMEDCPTKIRVNALIKKSILITGNLNSSEQIEKDLELAVKFLESAKDLDPTVPDTYLHIAQSITMLGRMDEVISHLDKAIQYHPKFYSAIAQKLYIEFNMVAKDSYYNTRPEKYMAQFKKQIEQNDNAPEIQQIYAQILTELNCYEQADEVYEKLLKRDPMNYNALISRALLQLHLKNDPDTISSMIRDVIKKFPKNLIAYELLGSLEQQRDQREEAIKIFETALSHAQSEAEYVRCYGLLNSAKSQKLAVESLGLQS